MAYASFKDMTAKLSQEKGITNPSGLAAYLARRKYGAKAVQHAASYGETLQGHKKVKR